METIAKSFNNYMSKGSFEERLGQWLRAPVTPANPLDPPGAGLNREVDALLEESEEEGIIPALWDRNRQIISLIEYQDRKQNLGEEVVSAHEAFHSILDRALSAHDRVIREEETKASALLKVKGAMDSLEQLFNKAKEFYVTEPSRDASAAVCFMYGNKAFQETVDENSLQDVLIQTAAEDPRLMLNVQPNISTIRDWPNLQHLMTMLIEESTRINSILTTREDKNQERILKKRALQRKP